MFLLELKDVLPGLGVYYYYYYRSINNTKGQFILFACLWIDTYLPGIF